MDGQSLGLTDFFGIRVPPQKGVDIGTTPGPEDDSLDTIHLSQVALGPDAKKGRHVVWVEFGGIKSVIGSLTLGGIEQFQIDFPVNRELTISHSGSSDVYLTGYTTHQFLTIDSSDSDSSGLSDSEDGEGLPRMINGRQRRGRLLELPVGDDYTEVEYQDDEASEGSSEDSDDDSDEEDNADEDDSKEIDEDDMAFPILKSRSAKAHKLDVEDDDDDNGAPGFLALADTVSGGIHPPMDSDESDDSASESGYEEDEEEEADDDQPAPQILSSKGAKRKAASIPGSDLKTNKKAKTKKPTAMEVDIAMPELPNFGKKSPAASTPGATGTPSQGAMIEYQNSLKSFLKLNGPTKMAVVGSEVKRVAGLPKLKRFVKDRQETYQLNDVTGMLSLKE